jgi:hypothetical protein
MGTRFGRLYHFPAVSSMDSSLFDLPQPTPASAKSQNRWPAEFITLGSAWSSLSLIKSFSICVAPTTHNGSVLDRRARQDPPASHARLRSHYQPCAGSRNRAYHGSSRAWRHCSVRSCSFNPPHENRVVLAASTLRLFPSIYPRQHTTSHASSTYTPSFSFISMPLFVWDDSRDRQLLLHLLDTSTSFSEARLAQIAQEIGAPPSGDTCR